MNLKYWKGSVNDGPSTPYSIILLLKRRNEKGECQEKKKKEGMSAKAAGLEGFPQSIVG